MRLWNLKLKMFEVVYLAADEAYPAQGSWQKERS
jgi:hypothetical protein